MNILVVGSSGFIGSHLCRFFSAAGHEVTGCDIRKSEIELSKFFLLSPEDQDFGMILQDERFDICINASGSASVPFSITNPADDFRLNVTNVYLWLHNILKYQPSCRFLNFSSAAVYGNPQILPIKENIGLSPVSPYGFHKMISEHVCCEFYKLYGISACSLRVFSAFGPGLRKQLFWDLMQKAKTGKSVELFGTGNESRDFIFIDDLVSAVNLIMRKSSFKGEVLNVAGGEEITIRRAAEAFFESYSPGKFLVFSGMAKKGDPLNWKADISKLISMGFYPATSFEEGIKKYSHWLKAEEVGSN